MCWRSRVEAGTTVVEERHDALELGSEEVGFGTHDEWRVGGDDPAAVDDLGELRRGPDAILAIRLRHRLANQLLETLAFGTTRDLRQVVDLDTRVPDVEGIGHRREREGCAIDLDRRRRDRTGLLGVQTVVPSCDHEARHEPLDVPFEGAGQRLVEVVHVDDEPTIGCGEGTEVGDVGVAAELDLEVGARGSAEIRRHHGRGAAEEREGGGDHAAVADRHELRQPARVLARRAS